MAVKDDTVRRVAQNAGAALVYVDTDLRVRFANRRCHQLLGHAPDALHGRQLADLVDTVTLRFARAHVAEVEKGTAAAREYALRHSDGSKRFVQVSAVADRDPAGRSVGYVLSASDARPPEAERQTEAGLARPDLLAAANHALRTPLASVIAALELLQDEDAALSGGTARSLLAIALESAGRLAVVVEQWLDMERLEAGVTPLEAVPLQLDAMIAGLVGQIARSGAAAMRLQLSRPGKARVRGDAARLRQAVSQLIGAALQRTAADTTVKVALEVRARRAVLSIEDEASRGATGVDLGVLLAETIIKRSGGTLQVEQPGERGTRVSVTLPCLGEDMDG